MMNPVVSSGCRFFFAEVQKKVGRFALCNGPEASVIKRTLFAHRRIFLPPVNDVPQKEVRWICFFMGVGVGFLAPKVYDTLKQSRVFSERRYPIEPQPTSYISSGRFQAQSHNPIPAVVFARIIGDPGLNNCPFSIKELAYVEVSYYDLKGRVQVGEIIVHEWLAERVMEIFQELFARKERIDMPSLEQCLNKPLGLGTTIDIKGPKITNQDSSLVLTFQAKGFLLERDSTGNHFTIGPEAIRSSTQ